ncbi:glycosyltransferase family 2 protein [Psychrobacter maritimus]|uniref:glycosyltransferase family A protein n=1 Tax=Psychrobacter maritimus TaxID=256325 RepID=UPI00248B020F|nr:glycosyltransferase family 2 protein [Psychrobacter sp. WB2]WGV12254.1 glycosyltransferase family 2 protein [Psychrobacter sp. WB2]
MIITIFTPTFNRKETLARLYNSLLRQTYKSFEWVIVDDGSTDDTESLIRKFIKEDCIKIIYYKQANGGKHRAINKGLQLADGELFFIVDSDDYLLDNSLEIVSSYYHAVKDDDNIIGVTGFRCYPNGDIIGGKLFPDKVVDSNLLERRRFYKISADMAHVIKTELFKEFLFPDISNEKFVAESIVWNKMSTKYKMRYFNEPIYVGEYLEGGLSHNSIKNRRKNPKYSSLLYRELVNNPIASSMLKFKSAVNYWRFSFCKSKNILLLIHEIGNYKYSLPALPLGFVFFVKDNINDNVDINMK